MTNTYEYVYDIRMCLTHRILIYSWYSTVQLFNTLTANPDFAWFYAGATLPLSPIFIYSYLPLPYFPMQNTCNGTPSESDSV